jgi:two-component system, cell cycle sensor histidine kinase and response regulator CckA
MPFSRPAYLILAWIGALAAGAAALWRGRRLSRLQSHVAAREADLLRPLEDSRRRVAELEGDLTRARDAAAAFESRFRSAFEQVAVGMNHVTPDGRFLRVNQRYCALTGYAPEDLLRLRVSDITHPDDLERDLGQIERLLRGDCPTASWEKRYIRKDGSIIWVNLTASVIPSPSGAPQYLSGVVEDVTARIHAQEALRQSEQRFRQVVEHAPFGIFVESGLEFRYLNRAAAALFGAASPQQLVGASVLDRVHPEDRAAVRERSREAVTGDVAGAQRRFLRLDGEPFPAEVFPAPIVYDREPAALVLVRDRSEEQRMEQERLRLEQRLYHAQRMESVGRLAGGVAHDFNNHLTVISGYCDMLLEELAPDDPLCEEVGEIRGAATRAATLTRQLLTFSRKLPAEPRPLDLNAVVEEHCRILGRLIGDRIEVIFRLAPDLCAVEADRDQLQQALMSIAVNARDAMPNGGKLTFETANVDLAASAEGVPPGPYVVLTISDSGVGMSPEVAARIFDPFFTTKPPGSATGLGLSMVYGIVEQSGGFIRVTSRPAAGSTFRIYLPRTTAALQPPPAVRRVAAPARGSETILLVEDQPEVRKLALGLLRKQGYQVLEAPDGKAALDVALRHTGPIHLLLTDVAMPGMNGRELAERLHASQPRMKVLYVSGYSAEVFGAEAEVPPSGYLGKPFAPGELVARVQEILGRSDQRRRVLIIDDDSAVREFLCELLAEAGYEVHSATDGDAGLSKVEREQISLVITDLVMPGREGIETVQMLRRRFPEVRIIAVSGAFDGEFLKAASRLGADATFPKPIDPDRLLPAVRALLSEPRP